MLTPQQAIELWESDDLIAIGTESDGLRKRLHPEGIVTYTLAADDAVCEHVFQRVEPIEQRLNALAELRDRQQQFGDVIGFRPIVEASATGVEYIKAVALSRLYLDNVPHIQGSLRFGLKIAQLSLCFGADDLELAGDVTEEELRRVIRDAGFVPKQRDALFRTYSLA
jgi:cyclic dehypoxanthinyl futalosine synthase